MAIDQSKSFEVSEHGTSFDGGVHVSSGTAVPTHQAPKGSWYWRTGTTEVYQNTDGGTTWAEFIPAAGEDVDQTVLQVERSTSYAVTTTLTNLAFDTTGIENDSSILDHASTNTNRVYFNAAGFFLGIISIEVVNTHNQDCTFTIQPYVDDVAPAAAAFDVKIGKTNSMLVTRPLFIYVGPGGITAGQYITVRVKANINGALTTQPLARVVVIHAKGKRGPAGPIGPTGDITWEGVWVSGNYTPNQAVQYQGTSYVCHTATTTSQVPTDSNYWDIFAKGPKLKRSIVSNSIVIFTATSWADVSGMSTTVTLNASGKVSGMFGYSFTRTATGNSHAYFRIVINGVIGPQWRDSTSDFYDVGSIFRSENLAAGTYTVKVQAKVDNSVTISQMNLVAEALED